MQHPPWYQSGAEHIRRISSRLSAKHTYICSLDGLPGTDHGGAALLTERPGARVARDRRPVLSLLHTVTVFIEVQSDHLSIGQIGVQ